MGAGPQTLTEKLPPPYTSRGPRGLRWGEARGRHRVQEDPWVHPTSVEQMMGKKTLLENKGPGGR